MIVELRTYQTKPGMRETFLRLFQSYSIPEHWRLGIPITGPFLVVDDPDTFFFMRSFASMAAREVLKDSFYSGPLWKKRLEGKLMPMLTRYDVSVVDDTEGSLATVFKRPKNSVEI